MHPLILIFVDGLGIGEADAARNPVAASGFSFLAPNREALSPVGKGGWQAPTDARLGVPGLPQSATGQAALLSGVNAPQEVGGHQVGFPNGTLRRILLRRNLLKSVRESGGRAAFINAYPLNAAFFNGRIRVQPDGELACADDVPVRVCRRVSVTSVAALSIGQRFRDLEDLRAGRSLYHDFTNRSLAEQGVDAPLRSPAEAGQILHRCARELDFTLYEYFLTDRAGHAADLARGAEEMGKLDTFLRSLLDAALPEGFTVLLTSDHGNIEDCSSGQHTSNPVPTVFWGARARECAETIHALTDIHDVALQILAGR